MELLLSEDLLISMEDILLKIYYIINKRLLHFAITFYIKINNLAMILEVIMKKFILIFILLSCITFTSCNSESKNTETSNGNTNTNKEILQMKSYKKTIDNVVFDTKICIGDKNAITEDSLVTSTVSMVKSNPDKLYETLFSNIKVEKKIVDTNGQNYLGKPMKTTIYQGNNESILQFDDISSTVFFNKDNFGKFVNQSIDYIETSERYNLNKYPLTKNLDFATRETAFKNIQSTLASFGLEISNNYKAYALDHKTLQEEEFAIDMDGNLDKSQCKTSWAKDDDCYYFLIRPTFKDIPMLYTFDQSIENKFNDFNSPIKVIYTKKGIQSLDILSVFSPNKDEKKVTLAPFDEIAETIAKPYTKIIGDTSYKVTDANLVYILDTAVTNGKYPINPAWVVHVQNPKSNEDNPPSVEIIIDAVTGKEIVNGK